jgi:hypothetical protein
LIVELVKFSSCAGNGEDEMCGRFTGAKTRMEDEVKDLVE